MAGRMSSAVENALAAYKRAASVWNRTTPPAIYAIAAQHGISHTSLYRAIERDRKDSSKKA